MRHGLKRKTVIIKNSVAGFVCQIVSSIVQFIVRIFMLKYVGIEIIGINATFSSILQTLSLTELGFQTAVVYYLYNPLYEHNTYKVSQILVILKRVYGCIGVLFMGLTVASIPLLPYILKDTAVTTEIIVYYLLMGINIAFSYFLAYRRALLLADQLEYVSKIIDSVFSILICMCKIIALVVFKSFAFTLVLQILQTIGSNIVVTIFCKKRYRNLVKCKFDMGLFSMLAKDVKNVFAAKIAGYVYDATDNLIISTLLGTVYVGYLSNYTTLTTLIKQIINSVFSAMTSVIGNILVSSSSIDIKEQEFRAYSYVRYVIAAMIVVPWVLLANDIVEILFGSQYVLSESIVILLAVDIYIHTYNLWGLLRIC